MTKDQQKIVAGASVIAVLVLILAYVALIGPQWKSHQNAKTQATDLTTQLNATQTQLNGLRAQQANVQQLVSDANLLLSQFPEAYDQDQVIKSIYRAATGTGVSITSIAPIAPQDLSLVSNAPAGSTPVDAAAPPIVTAPTENGVFPVAYAQVAIAAEGNFAAQMRFLGKLRDLPRPMAFVNVAPSTSTINITGRFFLTRPIELPVELGGKPKATPSTAPGTAPAGTPAPGTGTGTGPAASAPAAPAGAAPNGQPGAQPSMAAPPPATPAQ